LSFHQIYHAHKNLVYNLALQYVQNVLDAEEITQDVFVTIDEKLHTFKDLSNIKTWIYRITINKSLDFLKAKKRKKRFAYIISLFHIDGSDKNIDAPFYEHPGVALENKESINYLFTCINQLPDNQKTVIILLKIEDKKASEVALIMNLSEKAIGSLFTRAKLNLKKLLNPIEDK
jgi:RNA polymerase sigma factor (sigma-70 family)